MRRRGAIFRDSAVPPEWDDFIKLDARWCRCDQGEKQAVRARIDEIQPPGAAT
jgi:hypothetical protein